MMSATRGRHFNQFRSNRERKKGLNFTAGRPASAASLRSADCLRDFDPDRLRNGPANVQDLVDAAGTTQQNVSKHLTRLAEHGFIAREHHGSEHLYRIIDRSPLEVLDVLSTDLADQLRHLADMMASPAHARLRALRRSTRAKVRRCRPKASICLKIA